MTGAIHHSQLAHDLRTAAMDLSQRSVRRGIQQLAKRVERGESLQAAIGADQGRLPLFHKQALLASAKTGDLPVCLAEMARYDRAVRDLRSNLMVPLVYSGAHLLFFLAALVLFGSFVGNAFKEVLLDFGVALPPMTEVTLAFATDGVPIVLRMLLATLAMLVVGRVALGRAGWRFFLYTIPGAGPLFRWMGTWQLVNLTRLLVERSVPLDEALRTAADGVSDANVAQTAQRIAGVIEQGGSFAAEMEETARLSRSAAPLIRWGEEHDQMAAALQQVGDMLEGRMTMHAAWLRTVVPPITTVLSGALALVIATSTLLPLVSLIHNLS